MSMTSTMFQHCGCITACELICWLNLEMQYIYYVIIYVQMLVTKAQVVVQHAVVCIGGIHWSKHVLKSMQFSAYVRRQAAER
jgi:hypothetical protein